MKLIKTASGKQTIKLSKKEWTDIGKKAGWMKISEKFVVVDNEFNRAHYKDIIGKIYDNPPSYAAVEKVESDKTNSEKHCPECNEIVWDKTTADQHLNKCWNCGLKFFDDCEE